MNKPRFSPSYIDAIGFTSIVISVGMSVSTGYILLIGDINNLDIMLLSLVSTFIGMFVFWLVVTEPRPLKISR